MTAVLPRYDIERSYDWNFDHAPDVVDVDAPAVPGEWKFCGLPVASPLGIPAGPLLNGHWVLYYASLGYDVLTYKTVRSSERECYPLPNLVPVAVGQLVGGEAEVVATAEMARSWAVSFGMPSKAPEFWRRDIEWTRTRLPAGKLLSVSVVGTVQDDWTPENLADDYAQCARWAVESGADCIETNFSCPNVSTCDGQLYQQAASARLVAERVRAAIGRTPYIVKIGHVTERDQAAALIEALSGCTTALAMTNSVAARVVSQSGESYFAGQPRGICGDATRKASIAQTKLFAELAREAGSSLEFIGVGGAATAEDVREYLDAGAHAVHIATAAMVDPLTTVKIRRAWNAAVAER